MSSSTHTAALGKRLCSLLLLLLQAVRKPVLLLAKQLVRQ
jgi:hypothetical protein